MRSADSDRGASDLQLTRRWLSLLLRCYPPDFRDEMGAGLVATYLERARVARAQGSMSLARLWWRALIDSLHNGMGERMHPAISWRRSGDWGRDAELVLRRLIRAPVFVLAIVGTLAVGLGAFAVVYTVVHQVLLAPLPYEDPDDLYFVWRDYRTVFDLARGWTAGTDVAALAQSERVIEDAVALRTLRRTLAGVSGEHPMEISVMVATPNVFDVLGVQPALGRGFRDGEGGPGRPPVIVLTHALWNRLGADPAIVGRELRVSGQPHTVIGVMGRDFEFVRHASEGPPQSADAYTTFDIDLATTNPGAGSYAALIRARPGTPAELVQSAVDIVGQAVDERDHGDRGILLYAVPLKEDLVSRVRPALIVVGLAGLFLVLVLLVNLALLLLVRAVRREKEFAISRALGANTLALVRATVLEAGLLGLLGGAAAALVAIWAARALVALAPADLPRRSAIAVDWPIALIIIGVGLVLGLLAGLIPAAWAAGTRLSALLSAAAVRGGGGHGRMRRSMVVLQVALSLVLLTAGGLVVRSFQRLVRAEPGFDAAGVLTVRVPILSSDSALVEAKQQAIQRELAAIPGVTVVGAVSALPLSADANQTTLVVPGAPGNTGEEETDQPLVDYMSVRPGYFEAIGIRVLEGSTFGPNRPEGPLDALIDDQIAGQFFPGASAVGAIVLLGGDSLRVIGVVQHARMYEVHENGRPQVFVRNAGPVAYGSLSYAIRTERDPTSLTPEVRAAIDRVDPELAIADVKPMEQIVAESVSQERVSAVLIAGFSLGALLLAAMGLFGVVAGSVTRRRHELALRLALGADHDRVLWQVLGDGARLVAFGLLVGAPGVFLAGRVMETVLVGVSPWDPGTIAGVSVALGAVALLACWVPARQVVGIDPARALREE